MRITRLNVLLSAFLALTLLCGAALGPGLDEQVNISLSGIRNLMDGGTAGQLLTSSGGNGDAYWSSVTAFTGLSSVSQGDIIYADGTNTLTKLAKNTSATRVLTNTGTSNNPAWAQVTLTNGVTGTLPFANGGFGFATATAGDLFYASATDTPNKLVKSTRDGVALRNTGASNVPAYGPIETVVYSSLTASATHDGATAAETLIMPATDEGTGETDIATFLLTGARLHWYVVVPFTGDADGDETITVNVYFGGTLVGTSGAVADDGPDEIILEGDVKIVAGGATGTGIYSWKAFKNAAFIASDTATIGSTDFTAVTPFQIKLDFGGTTDAADTALVTDATLVCNNFD